jgi:AcrR family transcriptional regulator
MKKSLKSDELQPASRMDRVRRKPERPAEILAAAFEEFVLKGYAASRLEDVATRAGVTKGTIYFHFENKEQVFFQMVRELSKPIREKANAFLSNSPDDAVGFISHYLDFAHRLLFEDRHAREILRLLISEATRFPELVDEHFAQFIAPIFEQLHMRLARASADGTIRQSPAIEFPDLILSPVMALNIFLLLFSDRKPMDAKQHLEAAKDLLLNGLLPRN